MTNQPSTHEALKKEFVAILSKPFKAEDMAVKCTDIVVRERMKILTTKSFSDRCTGEWVSHNPHAEESKSHE